jgi:hypothetical protein
MFTFTNQTKFQFKYSVGETGGCRPVDVEVVEEGEIAVVEKNIQDGMIGDFSTYSDSEVQELKDFMESAFAKSNERLQRYADNLNNDYYTLLNLTRGVNLEIKQPPAEAGGFEQLIRC